jgi:tetratricopeptide (TPR) repeat protein
VLQKALVQQMRNEARESLALEAPAGELADKWDEDLHDLAAALSSLGNTLMLQRDPECISHFQESLVLGRRINNRELEVSASTSLGQAYIRIPEPSDLELAERWFRHSLSLLTEANRSDRASILAGLGRIARIRLERAQRNGEAVPVLAEHIEKAYLYYHEALDLTPAVDHATRGHIENGLGLIYQWAPSPDEALRYFQRAIQHHEACDDARAAGETRCNTARFLAIRGRFDEALQYASAALDNYRQAGPSAITDVAYAERLLASIKRMALEHGQG